MILALSSLACSFTHRTLFRLCCTCLSVCVFVTWRISVKLIKIVQFDVVCDLVVAHFFLTMFQFDDSCSIQLNDAFSRFVCIIMIGLQWYDGNATTLSFKLIGVKLLEFLRLYTFVVAPNVQTEMRPTGAHKSAH